MRLPFLFEWTSTRVGLHQAAQVVGAVRAAVAVPETNWTHIALRVAAEGLTTGPLPDFGELVLDFNTQAILFNPLDRDPVGFSLALHSQQSLAEAVEAGLNSLGFAIELDYSKLTGNTLLELDPTPAADYGRILRILAEVLGDFRASLPGEKSPLVVWPHGFDLAFLWFATDIASEDAPHMGFGFSPFSDGLERPYLYTYPYPLPDGLTDLDLPAGTRWYSRGWTGTVSQYDELLRKPDPVAAVEQTLALIFDHVSPLL